MTEINEELNQGLTQIAPPEGVSIFDDREYRFGLSRMYGGQININPGAGETSYVDGTVLDFKPEIVRVEVARNNLNSHDINHIGELFCTLNDYFHLRDHLDSVLASIDGTINSLRTFGYATRDKTLLLADEQTQPVIDEKSEQFIAETAGVDAAQMKERKVALEAKIKSIEEEAHGLGVVLITLNNRSIMVQKLHNEDSANQ